MKHSIRHAVSLLEQELAAAGANPLRSPGPFNGHELTPSELHTAELAAIGLNNLEISRRRSVSRKTVESQLSSVYRKLGIGDRSQLLDALGSSSAREN